MAKSEDINDLNKKQIIKNDLKHYQYNSTSK